MTEDVAYVDCPLCDSSGVEQVGSEPGQVAPCCCDDGKVDAETARRYRERVNEKERDELMGSLWRDEHGNHWRIYSAHWTDDPELRLRYVPPPQAMETTLSELRASCVALPRTQVDRKDTRDGL